jgi:hypothetical protein
VSDETLRGRLLLGLPLYTHVSTNWFIRFLSIDRSSVVDTIAIRKMYLASAMDHMVSQALESNDWDRLVVYEADMMPPLECLNRIAGYPDSLDIVGSIYFQHPPPHVPVVYNQVDDEHWKPLHHSQIKPMMDRPGLYPVDAVGMGLTSIHRRVFEKWNPEIGMFGGEQRGIGHDMYFCRGARAQGFSVHVDTGIHCGHLTEWPITYENHAMANE